MDNTGWFDLGPEIQVGKHQLAAGKMTQGDEFYQHWTATDLEHDRADVPAPVMEIQDAPSELLKVGNLVCQNLSRMISKPSFIGFSAGSSGMVRLA